MSSSDDDDDVPLASLKKSQNDDSSEEEAEFEDQEEEEEEEEAEEEEDDTDDFIVQDSEEEEADEDFEDSDSDVPLAALKKKKTSPAKKTDTKKKAASVTKKKKPAAKKKVERSKKSKKTASTTKKKKTVKRSSSSVSKSSTPSSTVRTASAALYNSCDKGKLIQAVLCRWWYAVTWPDPDSIPKAPPKHYDALDGFPGVYICTSGQKVGRILDKRDRDACPNFQNYAKKSSDELQQLLIKAIEKQRKALVQAEGEGTATEKDLMDLLKWAKKLNPAKCDKQAATVLKAAKLSLL